MIPTTSFGEVCLFENGDRGKNYPSQDSFVNEGIPFINAGDLNDNRINPDGLSFITESKFKSLGSGKIQPNDILFCLRGSLGKFALNDQKLIGAIASSLVIIRPGEKLDVHYLKNFLKSPGLKRQIDKSDNGSSQPNLSAGSVKQFKIPLPPLATQKKIAAILDAADAHRQKTKQLLAKYDELAQSIFLEMFGDPVTNPKGWEIRRLEEVCKKITDGTHHSPEPQRTGVPYVTAKHVKPFKLDFESKPTFVRVEDHKGIYSRCSPRKGDVLYIKDGATTGVACLNTFEEEISLLSSLALIQTDKERLISEYLCYWLNFDKMKSKLISVWVSGAAIQRYTLKKIKSFEIMIPPIGLQKEFLKVVDSIDVSKRLLEAEFKKGEDLFNSLLQKAFKGELVR